ncbi:DPCD [Bugula neritina]|uniref:Protein DPCD n=1 Tax=Bugula neritina TaxID=10212 RepID=A0A7J7J4G5_BUGNE|nr:DPCD [Bugula neritina]
MATSWQQNLETAQKTALLQDGKRKVHYTFNDGKEMVEEYDAKTNELVLRKWKELGAFGNAKPWQIEVGEVLGLSHTEKEIGLMESLNNPVVVRRDKLDAFQWRIRNLPYPIDTYNVTIEEKYIVVRTSNKKYFKKLNIPDLDRLNLDLNANLVTFTHANNTLIITYKKPSQLLEFETKLIEKLKSIKAEGDVNQCRQQ